MTKRVKCANEECGTMVLKSAGECRKCRRLRLRASAKRIAKLGKKKDIISRIKHFFASKAEQYKHSKALYWNRPKQTVRGLHIPDKTRRQPPWA